MISGVLCVISFSLGAKREALLSTLIWNLSGISELGRLSKDDRVDHSLLIELRNKCVHRQQALENTIETNWIYGMLANAEEIEVGRSRFANLLQDFDTEINKNE